MVGVLVCVLFVFCCVTCLLTGLVFGFYSRLAVVCVLWVCCLDPFCFGLFVLFVLFTVLFGFD